MFMKKLIVFLIAAMFSIAIFAQPPTPTATCNGDQCEDYITFSASPSDQGTNYEWEFWETYGEITSISGGNTATPDVYISVDAGYTYAGITARVRYFKNGPGWSNWSNYTGAHNYVVPDKPNKPSGYTSPMCCYRYYTYSTNDVDGAFNYRWNVWHGDHRFYGSETGQSANVYFDEADNTYTIDVSGWNAGCGEGPVSDQLIIDVQP
jgi:hypothetical protein